MGTLRFAGVVVGVERGHSSHLTPDFGLGIGEGIGIGEGKADREGG